MVEPHPEGLFRGIFESVPDAMVIVDDTGSIVLANAQCRAVFGCEPGRLVGVSVDELVPARFRAGHPRRRAGYGAERNPRPMGLLRLSALRVDGTEFPAEISLAPIEVHGNHYVSTTVRDITDRLKAEERFRSLLEAAPDATVIVDTAARIVLTNNRVEELLGYSRSELVGQSVGVLAAAPGPEEVLHKLEEYLGEPESVPMGYPQEFRVRHRDGSAVPVEIALSPLETVEGLVVIVALRDVTERRRLEAESQRMRDDLIATVSHELRTPLTAIIGYAELMADLDESDLGHRARKLLGVIERNAVRELQLVDDLLTMAYLDDDRLRMVRAEVDLAAVCRRVVDDHALRARDRGLTLTFAGGDSDPVLGDFHRLLQVMENLVTNAIKFTPAGGGIEISLGDQGAMAVIEVRDTGVGVPSEELARLFERLYRGPQAIANHVQGAGLGLSIVRAIVEAHGGWIDLQSEVGVGTVVRVAVPHLAT